MKISSDQTDNRKLNMTPLIDVVFLLLIFFMVSTTFEKQSKLKIELPEASVDPVTQVAEELIVSVTQKGVMYVNNTELINAQAETLKKALNAVVSDARDMSVIIRADANTAHKHVVTVMDVLGRMGFNKVTMATTQATDSK